MHVPIHDMSFILRAAAERTEGASATQLRSLVASMGGNPQIQVGIVTERPFSAAVRRTFQLGLELGRPWIVALDADVLLLSDAIERLGNFCACADGAVFAITPLVHCKFFGGFCYKGVHCYPRRYLERALALIGPSNSAADLRPENAVIRAMDAKGFKPFAPPMVVGVHDHEQSYKHIYLKSRLRGRREAADAAAPHSDSLSFVSRLADTDPDYLVAMWGLRDGRTDAAAADPRSHYDWDAPYPEFVSRLAAGGLAEKPPLSNSAAGFAERTIASHNFHADTCTPRWIRERFGFGEPVAAVLGRMGVPILARAEPAAPAHALAS